MIKVIEGVVLLITPYNDTSSIVNVFTAEHGRLSFILANVRSAKSAVKRTHFQPLNRVEIVTDMKAGHAVYRIKESRLLSRYTSLLSHPAKRLISIFLTELLHRIIRNEDHEREMYTFVANSVEILELSENHFGSFHLVFLAGVVRILGFSPRIEQYLSGSYFDLSQGEFLRNSSIDALSTNETELLYRIFDCSFSNMQELGLTREDRNRMLDVILEYIRRHNYPTLQIKSLAVLREL